jgi:TonB family protein
VNTSRADESFALAQMPALMKTLDTCAADLRKVWKVWDYEKGGTEAGLKEGPSGNLSRLFDPDDYPAISILKDQVGSVAFALLIDEQGKVADCTVTQTSGLAALDAQSCAVVKARGKFKPAVGPDGKPSKSAYFQRITWALMR